MPEGPDIRYIATYINQNFKNKTLQTIKEGNNETIQNKKLLYADSIGKLLILAFDDSYIHIHCGLTGWILFDNPKYTFYTFRFSDNSLFYVSDQKRLAKVNSYDLDSHNQIINKLGIDVFSQNFTLNFFSREVKKTAKQLVYFLLEQNKFCGIGNYIKNDALYIAKISPKRKTNTLTDLEIEALYNAIRFISYSILKDALKKDNLTIDNFLNAINTEDNYEFRVYEKKKDPIGNAIIAEKIGGRNTFYVPHLQV